MRCFKDDVINLISMWALKKFRHTRLKTIFTFFCLLSYIHMTDQRFTAQWVIIEFFHEVFRKAAFSTIKLLPTLTIDIYAILWGKLKRSMLILKKFTFIHIYSFLNIQLNEKVTTGEWSIFERTIIFSIKFEKILEGKQCQ